MPIALVILLIVFGAVVAAGLPILLSLIAITMAVALTALVGQTFDVSVFAINMVSMMGLATGIDYSLFIISRFREERARGRDKLDAIAVTGGTASRAVLFSGLTVVLALLGLLIVPTNIFASLAIGAILVVSMSVLAALTLLPAVLSLLGDRVNSLKVPYLGRRILDNRGAGRTSWIARVAYRAMRRPAVALVVGVGVLLLLAYPALDMKTGVSGVNSFPNDFESKQGFAVLEKQFSAGGVNPVEVVVDGEAASPAVQTAMTRLTQELAGDPAFGPVQTQTAESGDLALLTVPVNGDAVGSLALDKVRELRGTLIPRAFDGSGASVYVTGQTAGNLDYIDIVNSYFPWVVALVLSLSFLLLLVAFRSIVIPIKAILMNLLSVGAAYGLVTLVSLKGWGADLLGFQQVPVVEQWVPLLLFAVLFGLSMDYQVFLLSRIKEAWDRTGDNTAAVTEGVGATAGIITGAALIMVAVFAGFAAGDLVMFQQMGFGLAVAVLLDATLIRIVLVPAAMKLLGRWNWYLPSWLEWLPHLSIEGAPAAPLRRAAGPGLRAARGSSPLRPKSARPDDDGPAGGRASSRRPAHRGPHPAPRPPLVPRGGRLGHVRPARERDQRADDGQRGAGEHRVAVPLREGVHRPRPQGAPAAPCVSSRRPPTAPSWLAAMPPSSATLSACPEVRIVPRKALAWLSWSRRTLPMMAEAFGALNAAMPTPTTPRQATTYQSGAASGRNASRAMPAAMASMPPVASTREPMRSLRRPLTGLSAAISSGMESRSQPVSDAERPWTSCR